MTRLLMAAAAAALLGSSSASAQLVGIGTSPSSPSPLGMTSPLGIGPALPVAPTGIPLGATELSSPGVSPMTSGVSPLGPATLSMTTCTGINSVAGNLSGTSSLTGTSTSTGMPTSGTSRPSTLFDGGGAMGATPSTTGTLSGAC